MNYFCPAIKNTPFCILVREVAKKRSSLNGPLRPKPPFPPSSLMAVGIVERWKKKVPKKVIFSLTPLPPLNGPALGKPQKKSSGH